jgi:hypothetical protein
MALATAGSIEVSTSPDFPKNPNFTEEGEGTTRSLMLSGQVTTSQNNAPLGLQRITVPADLWAPVAEKAAIRALKSEVIK